MKDVIIIPTYNEKGNVGKLLRIISSILPSAYILVVDDNSPDGTSQEVEKLKKEIPHLELLLKPKREGLGRAYILAFKKVLLDRDVHSVCMMDADFSYGARCLLKMLDEVDKFDVVIGSRYIKGGINGYPFVRRLLSRLANLYWRMTLGLPTRDCTCGFMCIKASLLRKIDLDKIIASGFPFLVELKYLLKEKGASFKEIPFILESRKEGKSKITPGVILEEIFTPLRLISKNYTNKLKNFSAVIKDVLKKRGIFFVIYYGPKVFYRAFIKRQNRTFNFQHKYYNYFYHIYNCTCLNERTVEVPIVWDLVKENKNKKILEIGNVLSHYFKVSHDVLDKYELADGVINQDVVDFSPSQKYDLIVSVSTLEHVGFDEKIKDPEKISRAIDNLKKCLSKDGKMIFTLCLGYNPEMDKSLERGDFGFTHQYFLKRISNKNEWQQVAPNEIYGIGYDKACWTAKGLAICTIGEVF